MKNMQEKHFTLTIQTLWFSSMIVMLSLGELLLSQDIKKKTTLVFSFSFFVSCHSFVFMFMRNIFLPFSFDRANLLNYSFSHC